MVDLRGQYEKIKEEVDAAIQSVVDETAFINGPQVKVFAKELADYNRVNHAVPCANGTDALQIAMMALGFKPGDEVIVPTFTYVATVEVIALLGLKPVFVDVKPDTFELDVSQTETKISKNTVGVVPVHLYGQCANMQEILSIAKVKHLKVIEDAAQAVGAEYTFLDGTSLKAGTMGDIGTTSFFPSKNLGCFGDGGAMLTNNDELAERIQMIANHGQKRKYYHDSIGVNSRLDTIQAAILSVKLKYLDTYCAARNEVAAKYDDAFTKNANITIPARAKNSSHVFHQYTIKVNDESRDALKDYLHGLGIPSMVYYPVPLHLQKAYLEYGYKAGDFPNAEALCRRVLSLPIHTEMTADQQEFIIEKVNQFFNE